MATLSLQLRLGASRGWRVRSLIKAKFYAQSVIHCLFIFTLLRAKGFSQRMWTLHYGVFTNNVRYFIFVEYFRLPHTWFLLRPFVRQYALLFTKYTRRGYLPKINKRRYAMWITPHAKKLRHLTTELRKCPGLTTQQENLYWSWDRRAHLFNFVLVRLRTNTKLNTADCQKLLLRF